MILIIDDERRWISGYQEALILSGYTCELVNDVDELNKWLDNSDGLKAIDLVILDIMMAPKKRYTNEDTDDGMCTGEFILAEIESKKPKLPVIVLTNKDRDTNQDRFKDRCSHYLLKMEVTPQALVKMINNILEK